MLNPNNNKEIKIVIIKTLKYSALILLVSWLYSLFSNRIVIHYGNKDQPIEVTLYVEDMAGKTIDIKTAKLQNNSHSFNAPQLGRFLTLYDAIYASLVWESLINTTERLDILEEPVYPNDYCKLDIYLDNKGKFSHYEKTDFLFLNLCI
jgi:hypothetical protein